MTDQSATPRMFRPQRPGTLSAFSNIALVDELAIGDRSFTGHVSAPLP